MPYAAPHGLLTILGDAFTSTEEWQTGIRLTGTSPPTEAQFEALDDAVATFLGTGAVSFPVGRRFLGFKWAPQTVDGRYPEGADSVEWFRLSPLSGTGAGGYPQIAVVLSLRTARPRGYASNGRMYVPCSQAIGSSDGRISAATALGIATAGATLIAAINDVGLGQAAVMSAVGAGRTEPITGVRVGRVMDTQRRRRNQLAEEYTDPVAVPS
jgi:hypothetical protein